MEANEFSIKLTFPVHFHRNGAYSLLYFNLKDYTPGSVCITEDTWEGGFTSTSTLDPRPPHCIPLTMILVYYIKIGLKKEKLYSQEAYVTCPVPLSNETKDLCFYGANDSNENRHTRVQVEFTIRTRRQAPHAQSDEKIRGAYTKNRMLEAHMEINYLYPALKDILQRTTFPVYTLLGRYAPGWVFFSSSKDHFPATDPATWPFLLRLIHVAFLITTTPKSLPADLNAAVHEWDTGERDFKIFASYLIGALGACTTYRDDLTTSGPLTSPGDVYFTEKFERVLECAPYSNQNVSGDCEDCLYLNMAVYASLTSHPRVKVLLPNFMNWLTSIKTPVRYKTEKGDAIKYLSGYAGCLVDIRNINPMSNDEGPCHATGVLGPASETPLLIDSVEWMHQGRALDKSETEREYNRLYWELFRYYKGKVKIKRESNASALASRMTISELFLAESGRVWITTESSNGPTKGAFLSRSSKECVIIREEGKQDPLDTYINQFQAPIRVPAPPEDFNLHVYKSSEKKGDPLTLLALDVGEEPVYDFSTRVDSLCVISTRIHCSARVHIYIFTMLV